MNKDQMQHGQTGVGQLTHLDDATLMEVQNKTHLLSDQ